MQAHVKGEVGNFVGRLPQPEIKSSLGGTAGSADIVEKQGVAGPVEVIPQRFDGGPVWGWRQQKADRQLRLVKTRGLKDTERLAAVQAVVGEHAEPDIRRVAEHKKLCLRFDCRLERTLEVFEPAGFHAVSRDGAKL